MTRTVWHGTPAEFRRLQASVDRNCVCEHEGLFEVANALCAPHQALRFEQAFLDRVLFVHRLRERLLCEEWSVEESASCR